MSKDKEFKLESISYVHDPDAAKKWFEIYIELIKSQLLKENSKS